MGRFAHARRFGQLTVRISSATNPLVAASASEWMLAAFPGPLAGARGYGQPSTWRCARAGSKRHFWTLGTRRHRRVVRNRDEGVAAPETSPMVRNRAVNIVRNQTLS